MWRETQAPGARSWLAVRCAAPRNFSRAKLFFQINYGDVCGDSARCAWEASARQRLSHHVVRTLPGRERTPWKGPSVGPPDIAPTPRRPQQLVASPNDWRTPRSRPCPPNRQHAAPDTRRYGPRRAVALALVPELSLRSQVSHSALRRSSSAGARRCFKRRSPAIGAAQTLRQQGCRQSLPGGVVPPRCRGALG
jgi:hypothetical protein